MFKFGTVTDLDCKKAQAKVTFPDEHRRDGGEKFAVWLTVLMWRTKDVSMDLLEKEIEQEMNKGQFNLYRYIAKFAL